MPPRSDAWQGRSWILAMVIIALPVSSILLLWLGAHLVKRVRLVCLQWSAVRNLPVRLRNRFFLGNVMNTKLRVPVVMAAAVAVVVPQVVTLFAPWRLMLSRIAFFAGLGTIYFVAIIAWERKIARAQPFEGK